MCIQVYTSFQQTAGRLFQALLFGCQTYGRTDLLQKSYVETTDYCSYMLMLIFRGFFCSPPRATIVCMSVCMYVCMYVCMSVPLTGKDLKVYIVCKNEPEEKGPKTNTYILRTQSYEKATKSTRYQQYYCIMTCLSKVRFENDLTRTYVYRQLYTQ